MISDSIDKKELIIIYLNSLTETEKTILILRWANEFTFEEIESIVGIEKDEIMFQHKKLMLNLKRYLQTPGETNGAKE